MHCSHSKHAHDKLLPVKLENIKKEVRGDAAKRLKLLDIPLPVPIEIIKKEKPCKEDGYRRNNS